MHEQELPAPRPSAAGTEDRYRGPDRRASMAGVPPFPLPVPLTAVVAAAAVAIIGLRAAPGIDASLTATSTVARIILVVAGLAAVLRWRLDRMSRSYWFGLAAIAVGLPLLTVASGTRTVDAMNFASYLVTFPLVWFGLRSPEVDATRHLARTLAWCAPVVIAGFVLGSVDTGRVHAVGLIIVGAALLVLTARALATTRRGGTSNGRWFLPTLLATALGPVVGLAVGATSLEYAASGPMLLVAAGVAFTGSIAELHVAAARHQGLVLAATIARDDEVERRSRHEAETAERLHEVRSRVAAIEGGVAVMRAPDERSELDDAVRHEIERLRKLVAPASRDDAGPFNVLDALRPTLVVAASTWPVDFAIPEEIMAIGRADDLAQVVHGLLHNASKYAPGSPIEVTAVLEGDHVLVHVDDHGTGVPRGERELVFERGWRGERGGNGFGLGLAIARDLMTNSDGDLWVAPRPGGGARFTASLPGWAGLSSIDGPAHRPGSTPTPELSEGDRAEARRRLRGSGGTT